MEAIVIISGIVSLISLIVFFVMASNIAKIAKSVSDIRIIVDSENIIAESLLIMADKQIYLGNKEKAKEYFLRARYRYEKEEEFYYEFNNKCGYEPRADSQIVIDRINRQIAEL